ncbi:MAG: hypothetical protein J6N93_07605, partial [Clostridia bacterium]|nr:hypothetical protein [Clostridia bacterium]
YKDKKCYHILTMYETLCQGGNVDLKGCCEKFGISAVTFRRYIALLKEFFKDDKGLKLVNDRKNSVYFIRGGGYFLKEKIKIKSSKINRRENVGFFI